MKVLIYAVILGLLAGGLAMGLNRLANSDPGRPIRCVCANPTEDGTIGFALTVLMGAQILESPEIDANGVIMMDKWIQDHFQVVDTNNVAVPLKLKNQTPYMTSRQINEVPNDGFLECRLQEGEEYTLTYTPIIAEGKHYIRKFKATEEDFPYMNRFLQLRD